MHSTSNHSDIPNSVAPKRLSHFFVSIVIGAVLGIAVLLGNWVFIRLVM